MDKKEEIKKLKEEKRYEEIYQKFGMREYKKNTPFLYRKKDISRLTKEGKYEDIFNKYGKKEYDSKLSQAKYNDIKMEKGIANAILWRINRNIKRIGLYLGIASSALTLSVPGINATTVKENGIKYEKDIEKYDEKIRSYADEVNKLKLNDVQVFMKVIDDMWSGIKGYKDPERDIIGYLELDLANEDGYGVCRNMANDIAKKLNEINPDYNARTMVVEMAHEGKYETADIERNVIDDNETVANNSERESDSDKMADILGNHMITLVDVKADNLIVVLDPTNPGIGIYQNGKIKMLNSVKGNELNFDTRRMTTAVFSNGYKESVETVTDYAESYKKSKLTPEQIEEKYGLAAQNEALKEVRKIEQRVENDKKKTQKEKFREGLRVESLDQIKQKQKLNEEEKDMER